MTEMQLIQFLEHTSFSKKLLWMKLRERTQGTKQILEGLFYFKQLDHFILLQLQSPLLK